MAVGACGCAWGGCSVAGGVLVACWFSLFRVLKILVPNGRLEIVCLTAFSA